METKCKKLPPWKRKEKFKSRSFDDAFQSLGTSNGFSNAKEISRKLDSPINKK